VYDLQEEVDPAAIEDAVEELGRAEAAAKAVSFKAAELLAAFFVSRLEPST
jgi:hypothetical protein